MERSILDRPVQVDPALLGQERTIFGGIGAQFVEHESHVQRPSRLKFYLRPKSCKPRFAKRSPLALILDQVFMSAPLPGFAAQQHMGPRHTLTPPREIFREIGR